MAAFFEALQTIATPGVLAFMILGTTVGILFGAMPGLTATLAVAVFLPIVYSQDTTTAIALLLSLYVGGVSGGLVSAILINVPGTPASIATTFDGAPMARRGEGAKALGVAIVFSFIGTILSVMALIFIAPTLAKVAIKFGPYEYFAITVCSLLLVAGLAGKSMLKGIIAAVLGLIGGMVGLAPIDSVARFTFGSTAMRAGFAMLPFLVGLFAVKELLAIAKKKDVAFEQLPLPKIKGFGFTFKEFRGQIVNCLRSALIGLGIGILPGIGGSASNLIAYSVAKNSSKHPEKFGTGIIDGIVASETSNNACIGGAMITLLSLGIPGDAVTAMLLGGLTLKGLTLGPMFFVTNAATGYIVFACLIVASFMMLLIEFFGLRLFVRLLRVPLRILMPCVMVLCAIGAYASTNTFLSVWVFLGFGLVGFILSELKVPLAPMIIGFVLGPTAESYLRRGLMMSKGSFMPFFQSPIALGFFIVAFLYVAYKIIKTVVGAAKAKHRA